MKNLRSSIYNVFAHNLLLQEGIVPLCIVALVAVPIVLVFNQQILGACIITIGTVFLLCFFRNPTRICNEAQQDNALLVSPCDGKVIAIERYSDDNHPTYTQKVSIFLSPFDIHVNWTCMAGIISEVTYHKGFFYPAFLPKSSALNERNDIVITNDKGNSIKLRQITGTLARTIVCWVNKDHTVTVGQKYGLMKFGSRIDLFLPNTVQLQLSLNQKVTGGITHIGRWTDDTDQQEAA